MTRLESCMKRWVINKVHCQFQHWPLVKCDMDVNEFVKENGSEFLASLDCKGVLMQFHEEEDWCKKMTWETLKCTVIRDLQFALSFRTQKDDAHMCVKKHVVDAEEMDRETTATTAVFA